MLAAGVDCAPCAIAVAVVKPTQILSLVAKVAQNPKSPRMRAAKGYCKFVPPYAASVLGPVFVVI